MSTYENSKKVIDIQRKYGTLTKERKEKLADDFSIFLLRERITGAEYNDLIDLLKLKEDETNANT